MTDKNNKSCIIYDLYDLVLSRKEVLEEGSYTCYLLQAGQDKILKKIGEESAETIIAAKNEDSSALSGEICDLLYHLIVLMAEKGLTPDDIFRELEARAGKMHNLKKIKTVDKNT